MQIKEQPEAAAKTEMKMEAQPENTQQEFTIKETAKEDVVKAKAEPVDPTKIPREIMQFYVDLFAMLKIR